MDEVNGYGGWWFTWLRDGKANPEDYDGVEVWPCREYRLTDSYGWQYAVCVERCDPHEAEFWSAYVHLKEGGFECVGDFAEEMDAVLYATLVGLTHKWRYV